MAGKTTRSGQTSAETATTDTPDAPGAAVEVSDSGVEKAADAPAFEPVELTHPHSGKTVTARTKAQLVSLKFDGYVADKKA